MAGASVAARASGFGLPAETVDGQDVLAVYAAIQQARNRALDGQGPTFIEAQTYRYEGHNVGDVQNYREKSEVADWLESRDPIDRLRQRLAGQGELDDSGFAAATSRAAGIVADAIAFAEASPWPDTASVNRAWPAAAAGRP
jgi:acetoin:2,6-dichlorophenolindophenol oxidoreductase subunit alpha